MLVCCIEVEKEVSERGRLFAELDEDGREESTGVLFSGVFEIKRVGHMCCPDFRNAFNVLNDRRAIVVIVGYTGKP